MTTVILKNLPDEIYNYLKSKADKTEKDISDEIVKLLKEKIGNIEKKRDILELKGLGKEIWKDIEPQEYVNKERESWE